MTCKPAVFNQDMNVDRLNRNLFKVIRGGCSLEPRVETLILVELIESHCGKWTQFNEIGRVCIQRRRVLKL